MWRRCKLSNLASSCSQSLAWEPAPCRKPTGVPSSTLAATPMTSGVPAQVADEPGTEAHELYVRTHGAFAPGEQRRRGYDWASTGVNPSAFCFGARDKDDVFNGVGKALNPGIDDTRPCVAQIVPKRVEDARAVGGEFLGAARRLGAGDRNLPGDFCFGKPSLPPGVCPCAAAHAPSTASHACSVPPLQCGVLRKRLAPVRSFQAARSIL
jgi:hypothetical protein